MMMSKRIRHEWENWSMLGGVREWLVDGYGRVVNRFDPFSHRGRV